MLHTKHATRQPAKLTWKKPAADIFFGDWKSCDGQNGLKLSTLASNVANRGCAGSIKRPVSNFGSVTAGIWGVWGLAAMPLAVLVLGINSIKFGEDDSPTSTGGFLGTLTAEASLDGEATLFELDVGTSWSSAAALSPAVA
jgi:hypothetical protein